MIALRLQKTVQTPEELSDRQYGFPENKYTDDAIVEVRKIVDESDKRMVAALLFDIKGAFDTVWREVILESLKENDCPQNG